MFTMLSPYDLRDVAFLSLPEVDCVCERLLSELEVLS